MKACPVVQLCNALKVSRSGFYDWLKRKPSKRDISNQALARKLIELHEMYPVYGLDSLYHIIKNIVSCSRARVHRMMRKYNIHSIRYKSNSKHKYVKHNLPVKDNLLQQNFNVSVPSSVWVGDITYIKTHEGWLYLAIVKDLCSKQIVGYATSDKIDTILTIQALDKAINRQNPKGNLTFHSDRGSQYASFDYQQRLKHHGIKGSMSRSGNPYDNAVAENFFSCLKCELVHLTTFYTREQAKLEIFHYIEKYNNIRPHSAIGWISPNQFERNYNSLSA